MKLTIADVAKTVYIDLGDVYPVELQIMRVDDDIVDFHYSSTGREISLTQSTLAGLSVSWANDPPVERDPLILGMEKSHGMCPYKSDALKWRKQQLAKKDYMKRQREKR